jgi:RNA polymerase sigma factor (sigma-70 family)
MNRNSGSILRHLERLYDRGTATGLSEPALLERFVVDRDESAFIALISRYGPMVLGVCQRILRDERDVEDAFQATFLVFVRRVHAIRDPCRLGPWLHGVAHRVAVRARANAARRDRLESTLDGIGERAAAIAAINPESQELVTIIDAELAGLPSNLRSPIVLCYLEGLTHDEAAQRLRWPVGTVRSRMARARTLLRHRLARRGITPQASAIVATLARQPVPFELMNRTIQVSVALESSKLLAPAIAMIPAVTLAQGVLQTMFVMKSATIGAVALCGILAFGGVQSMGRHFLAVDDGGPVAVGIVASDQTAKATAAPESESSPEKPLDTPELRFKRGQVASKKEQLVEARQEASSLEYRIEQLEAELKFLEKRANDKSPTAAKGSDNTKVPVRAPAKPPENVDGPNSGKTDDEVRLIEESMVQARIEQIQGAMAEMKAKILTYDQKLEELEKRRKSIQQAPVQRAPYPAQLLSASNVLRAKNATKAEEPLEIRFAGRGFVAFSADRSTLQVYDRSKNGTHTLTLPKVKGDRRRFLSMGSGWSLFQDVTTTSERDELHVGPPQNKELVNRIGYINLEDGRCAVEDLPRPAFSNRAVGGAQGIHRFGNRIYAFSETAGRWGVLELEGLEDKTPIQSHGQPPMFVYANRFYKFNRNTGQWEDITESLGLSPKISR